MKLTLTNKIIIGFILGLVLGEFFFLYFEPEVSQDLGAKVQIVSKIFLRLIKMIVGPLVFCTLVVGIAKLGDFNAVGRIGIKTIGYFYFATILSLVTGLVVVNITQPGSLQSWPKPAAGTATGIDASKTKTLRTLFYTYFRIVSLRLWQKMKSFKLSSSLCFLVLPSVLSEKWVNA